MAYTLMEVTERTGLTAYTIRYYDKEGLLPLFIKQIQVEEPLKKVI